MNKNILITGCSSGLGESLANLYLSKGYIVYGINRSTPKIVHKNFFCLNYDLSNLDEIKSKVANFIKKQKEFETVFLNAGILGEIKELKNLQLHEIQKVLDINVYANKELLDILSETKVENIIATSSGASVNGSKGWAAYSLSKSSLNMLINLYSKEMLNTKLISLAPGVIKTPMTDFIRNEVDDNIFTSAKVLKDGEIQTPKEAAIRIENFLKRINEFESGSFIDIRNI